MRRLPAALGLALAALGCARPERGETFSSPSGNIQVVFVEKSKSGRLDPGQSAFVTYELRMRYKGGEPGKPTFTDVYGIAPGSRPAPRADLFARFRWSPAEDYVLLPEENWERAAGPPTRKAVNFNPRHGWKEASVVFEPRAWISPLRLIGEKAGPCEHSVVAFDGADGGTSLVQEGKDASAWYILSIQPAQAILQSQPGECPGAPTAEGFTPECLLLDGASGKAEKLPCPKP